MKTTILTALVLLSAMQAQAGVPTNVYSYSRTSSFTYYAAADGKTEGLLKTETVEPNDAQSCVTTTTSYDAYGNKTATVTANCVGATGHAVFSPRTAAGVYAAQTVTVGTAAVTSPAGVFQTIASNALGQTELHQYDPRFGSMTSLTGPNGLTTQWAYDTLGRKVQETRADGTRTWTWYCILPSAGLDTSSNSTTGGQACPTPGTGEAPEFAVSFVQTRDVDASGNAIGPFTRVYSDPLGRTIRTVTESFDGAGQPTGKSGAPVAKDTVYDALGTTVLQTQAYFLSSKSSTTAGSGDVGLTQTDHDALGRVTAAHTADPNGAGGSYTFADGWGSRTVAVTTIAYAGMVTTSTNDKAQTRKEEMNAAGELVRVTDANGAQLAHQRDAFGNLVATKDALQNQITLQYDIRGRKLQMADPDKGTWTYDYDAAGDLVWQQSPNELAQSQATTMAYDVLGRLVSRTEPEYTTTWSYDHYADGSACTKGTGKLCEVKTTSGIDRKTVYDGLGRPASTRLDVTGGPSVASAVNYDAVGRVAGQTYPTGLRVGYSYTGRGFLEKLVLNTAATVGGTNLAQGTLLWQLQAVDAWGKAEQQVYGNGVTTKAAYEATTGRTTALTAGAGASTAVLNQAYAWDSLNNLTGRTDANGDGTTGAVSETFSYGDKLDRLTGYTVSAPAIPMLARTVTLQYNALGMLLYKSDVGNYTYAAQGGVHPHALRSVAGATNASYTYDANGNVLTASAGKYTGLHYTSFNLPDGQYGISGNGQTLLWQYDEDHARIKETQTGGGVNRTVWYLNPDAEGGLGFEMQVDGTSQSNRHYLSAGGQAIGVLVTAGALPALTAGQTTPTVLASATLTEVEFWHKDHLGSLVATTSWTGAVTQRYAYDPFGKRRYANGNYDANGQLVYDWGQGTPGSTQRGFTGHEHLDDVGLINMNGRIFDPTLGVFLQGDPAIQQADNLQNYDLYGYCLNNPLTCTDPSGFRFLPGLVNGWHNAWHNPYFRLALAIAVSWELGPASGIWGDEFGLLGGTIESPLLQTAVAGFAGGAIQGGSFKSGVEGAFTAAAFFEAGELINGAGAFKGTGGWGQGTPQAVTVHAVVGCVTSVASGQKCGPGALSAAFPEAVVPHMTGIQDHFAQLTVSTIVGGTASVLGGGKFANGAESGAFGYLFNELTHEERAELVGGGALLGGTAGAYVAGGCTIGTGGICALGAPTIVGAGMAAGAVTGEGIANAWDQLENLIDKAENSGPDAVQYALVATRNGLYPSVGGQLVQLNAGEVWKYGISTDPASRYSSQAMAVQGLRMDIETTGTLPQVYVAEKMQLISYAIKNGSLPPGNRIFK